MALLYVAMAKACNIHWLYYGLIKHVHCTSLVVGGSAACWYKATACILYLNWLLVGLLYVAIRLQHVCCTSLVVRCSPHNHSTCSQVFLIKLRHSPWMPYSETCANRQTWSHLIWLYMPAIGQVPKSIHYTTLVHHQPL